MTDTTSHEEEGERERFFCKDYLSTRFFFFIHARFSACGFYVTEIRWLLQFYVFVSTSSACSLPQVLVRVVIDVMSLCLLLDVYTRLTWHFSIFILSFK